MSYTNKIDYSKWLQLDSAVRLLVDVEGLGRKGEIGDVIGVHPECGNSTYTVRIIRDGELYCNGCNPDEVEPCTRSVVQRTARPDQQGQGSRVR